jgi:hypothetical protein
MNQKSVKKRMGHAGFAERILLKANRLNQITPS